MNRCLRGRVSVAKPPPTLENSSSAVADETCGLGFDRLSPNRVFPIILSLSKDKLSPNGG
jgi:hypothetical protein